MPAGGCHDGTNPLVVDLFGHFISECNHVQRTQIPEDLRIKEFATQFAAEVTRQHNKRPRTFRFWFFIGPGAPVINPLPHPQNNRTNNNSNQEGYGPSLPVNRDTRTVGELGERRQYLLGRCFWHFIFVCVEMLGKPIGTLLRPPA